WRGRRSLAALSGAARPRDRALPPVAPRAPAARAPSQPHRSFASRMKARRARNSETSRCALTAVSANLGPDAAEPAGEHEGQVEMYGYHHMEVYADQVHRQRIEDVERAWLLKE